MIKQLEPKPVKVGLSSLLNSDAVSTLNFEANFCERTEENAWVRQIWVRNQSSDL